MEELHSCILGILKLYPTYITDVMVIVSVSFRRVAFELVLDLLFEES